MAVKISPSDEEIHIRTIRQLKSVVGGLLLRFKGRASYDPAQSPIIRFDAS
jgi:hypothetical protein